MTSQAGHEGAKERSALTRMLEAARRGDADAADEVMPRVYARLRAMADRQMRRQSEGHTFQPTDLVHEACLRLVEADAPWESRAHFFGVAAKAMRSVLVDHARARRAARRGGERERSPLHEAVAAFEERCVDLVALDATLTDLAAFDPLKARLVELRFFGGLAMPEIARILDVSLATLEREWTVARAWLRCKLA